jgi:signal peptidase II
VSATLLRRTAGPANLRWLWLSLAVIVADQATKRLILASFRPGEDLPLTSFASLVLAFNRGGRALFCAGLALIIGGALGNLYDRMMLGHVVDFLLLHYRGWYYPAFNVADSAITVGAAALILDAFRERRATPRETPEGGA